MAQLIVVVISIALMAALAAATFNYIPADAVLRQLVQKDAAAGLQQLQGGATRYFDAHRSPDGNIIYPGDNLDLKGLLAPQYSFIPADVRGEMTWDIRTASYNGLPAVAICVRPLGQSNPLQRGALENLQRTLPLNSAFVANTCGALSNQADGQALTYWLVLEHIN